MALRIRGLKDLERDYRTAGRKLGRAEAAAVRRTGTTIRARQARAVRDIAHLKVGEIKRAITVVRKPTAAKPSISFEVKEKGVPLIHYAARQTRKGVTVKVLRASGRQRVSARDGGGTPFIETGRGGGRQVFARTGKARLPIRKLWGPSIYSQYVKPAVADTGDRTWAQRLPIELDRAVGNVLRRLG